MKKFITSLAFILSISALFANISFSVDYSFFQTDKSENYVEFYLAIQANTVKYSMLKNSNGEELYQGKVEMTYLIENGDQVIAFEKFQINSPKYSEQEVLAIVESHSLDEGKTFKRNPLEFVEVKRLRFNPGSYTYTIIAKDLTTGGISEAKGKLATFQSSKDELLLSDIQLGKSLNPSEMDNQFSKAGFDILPSVTHNFIEENNQLSLYFEVYNANKILGDSAGYLIDISIIDATNEQPSNNLRIAKRVIAENISPQIQSFNLNDLPTGSYEVVVKVINRKNEVLTTKKVSFFRLNVNLKNLDDLSIKGSFVDSITNINLLAEYIKSIRVISTDQEQQWSDNRLKYAELEFMQRHFLNFWKSRNPSNPELAWKEYQQKLALVDDKFGYGGVNGYSTDRGRIYLQYGAPTDVQNVRNDGNNNPYSVWRYNKLSECFKTELNGLTDRKFIFYSTSNEMLGYEVLHSNVPGEVQNNQWEFALRKGATNRPGTRETENLEGQGRARDLFNNPR